MNNQKTPRRDFLKTVAGAGALAASGAFPLQAAKKKGTPPAEKVAHSLFESLTEEQRKEVAFPFDHPLRKKVDNNWQITKPRIGQFFNKDQQAMVDEIFRKIHSPEYADKIVGQVAHDSGSKALEKCSVGLFGEPGKDFEFVLTGRHCTRRCDGNSVKGAAFGGPIFYGHAAKGFHEEPHHPGNAYWYQAVQANKVFEMLDGKQRETALLGRSRGERGMKTIELTGKKTGLPGIRVADLSGDQKGEMQKVMSTLLSPFRKEDSDEAMKYINASGFDNLHMAFYKTEDAGKDGVWDVWQVEGPSMVWYFRGAPHVHTWVNIKDQA